MADRNQRPILFRDARIIDPSRNLDCRGGVLIEGGLIKAAGASVDDGPEGCEIVECNGKLVAPGLVDMRVFTGEPGAEHRETLASASQAAAAGGVTTFISMPDTDPVIDDIALVDFIARRARDTAIVRVYPMAAVTKGLKGREMTEMGLLREAGAVGFSDGRKTITNAQIMRRALTYARDFDAFVSHHGEDPDLVGYGVMNEGETATRLGLPGIPCEAEAIIVERDVRLADLTGGQYHAAQVSCADTVRSIRRAKDHHIGVTCGVSINHLTLNELDIGPYRTFFKLSPPLRAESDREAMVQGIADGTIDVIVSAHDPQDVETKRHPFADAADVAVGLETLLSAALRLYHNESCSLLKLIDAMSTRPSKLLDLD
ncbi:MAG: dihydroorotase, partial [Fimbriimonadaceae bacterium]|nr:dihydroorotase [Alphaproteobacteria bacterium]